MVISEKGINLIKSFESCRLQAYKCPAGVWTIGWGHTAGVKEGDVISQQAADVLLAADLIKYEMYVDELKREWSQGQYDALVSFAYNCGQGNLKKLTQNRSDVEIADAILLYNKSNGTVLAGLVRRREAERKLFIEGEVNKKMALKPVDYKQGDDRWGSVSYAVDGEKSTIKSAGCGPTAMADIIAALRSEYVDPLTTASWSRMKGYKVKASGTSYSFICAIAKHYGIDCTRLNTTTVYNKPSAAVHEIAKKALEEGKWLVACMGPGNWTSSGHYIVAYALKDGMVDICDPASSKATRLRNTWTLFSSQVKYYWTITPEIYWDNVYVDSDFIRECQLCLGANPDGIGGSETLSKTITVSRTKNRTNNVVYPIQKKFKKLNYYTGALDKKAGPQFETATKKYQQYVVGSKTPDGEITAKQRTWKKLLKII